VFWAPEHLRITVTVVMMSELEGEKEREETRREDQDDVFWTPKNVKVE
jgi:hypothetical protein